MHLIKEKFGIDENLKIDDLEEKGIVGPQQGSKPKEVLVELEDNR